MFDFLRSLFGSCKQGSTARQPASAGVPTATSLDGLRADWLVVGLGNPGAKYETTKHNVGFMALDQLVEGIGGLSPVRGHKAEIAVEAGTAYLRPTTFMNLSGEAVAPVARALGIGPEKIVVIHDELDLPPGKVRLKLGGNENGHNGLKSITEHLGTRDYVRVRIGIGRPPQGTQVPEWVLSPVEGEEITEASVGTAADAARLIVSAGLQRAQNEIHGR